MSCPAKFIYCDVADILKNQPYQKFSNQFMLEINVTPIGVS